MPDDDIVLDFSGVRLLAAAGLRVLLDLHDRRARAGMRVVLAAPSPSVQRVLVVTKLAHTLSMTATLDDAVALITAAPSRRGLADPRNATMDSTLHPHYPPPFQADAGQAQKRLNRGYWPGSPTCLRRLAIAP